MATAKFELLADTMYVDGKEFSAGDTVELDKARGDELAALGALKPAADKPAAKPAGSAKSEG